MCLVWIGGDAHWAHPWFFFIKYWIPTGCLCLSLDLRLSFGFTCVCFCEAQCSVTQTPWKFNVMVKDPEPPSSPAEASPLARQTIELILFGCTAHARNPSTSSGGAGLKSWIRPWMVSKCHSFQCRKWRLDTRTRLYPNVLGIIMIASTVCARNAPSPRLHREHLADQLRNVLVAL